jgi:hypothetical protein
MAESGAGSGEEPVAAPRRRDDPTLGNRERAVKLQADRAWDLTAGRNRMPGIFDARAMPEIFPVRGAAFLGCVAACQLLDMPDEIGRATQAGVSRRILCSNNVRLVEPWIRTSLAPGIELRQKSIGGYRRHY